MKKRILLAASSLLVLGGSALAADLPVLEAPPMVAPVEVALWSGFYIGAQVGYGFSNSDDNGNCLRLTNGVDLDCDDFGFSRGGGGDDDGFFIGAHAGYDYQINNWVFGGVADVNWVVNNDDNNNRRSGVFDLDTVPGFGPGPTISFDGHNGDDNNNWYGTLRGRIGWAAGRFLVYGTGGLAFGEIGGGGGGSDVSALFTNDAEAAAFGYADLADLDATEERCFAAGVDDVRCVSGGNNNGDDVNFGWTLGAGVDWLVTDNFSVGLEYLFVRLDSGDNGGNRFEFADGTTIRTDGGGDDKNDFHTIALKGSWRF